MRTAVLLIAVSGLCALAAAPAAAQTAPPRVADLPRDLLGDLGALPTVENGLWLLGGAALTVAVYQFEDAEGAARALDQGIWDGMSDFGNIWGDARLQLPLALGTWGIGAWADSPRTARTGYTLTRGLLLSYGVTSLLKLAVHRERPNGEDYSFPSGHTTTAFTVAGVLTRRYGGWIGGASLVLGGFTAMGRMEDLKHYASDVVAGATIGWIIGRTVARGEPDQEAAWRVVPAGRGLALVHGF
jgi:membrane-associated phospholipid phosphatase